MTNNKLPKVSILIPSYNHAAFVEKAIRSVWEQNYNNLELVIVDDGSTDNSREIIAGLAIISPIRMIFIEQKNAGICATLNRALNKSTGAIVGLLASDDIMLPNRLNAEVKFFEMKSQLKVLYSNGHFLQLNGDISGDLHGHLKPSIKYGISGILNHMLTHVEGFYTQSMLIKRDFLLDIGAFDESTGSDDWSLNIRIFKSINIENEYIFIDRAAFLYRVHQTQSHRNYVFLRPIQRKVIRKYWTLNNRAKFISQEYVKRAFHLFLQKSFKHGLRYINKACLIGFSEGVPVKCILRFGVEFPGYVYRELKRQLKLK